MDAASMWDERYGSDDRVFGVEPNQFVAELTGHLPPGRVLDLGAGQGRNAVWLATRGHDVTAVDISAVGLSQASDLGDRTGVVIATVHADLAGYEPEPAGFDLVLLSYLQLPPDLRAVVHRKAVAAVAPGGIVVLVAHHRDNLTRGVGGPPYPAVLYDEAMLRGDFADLDVERCEEAERMVRGGTPDEAVAVDVVLVARRHAS